MITVVLAAHIALRSSHQFSKIIISKSPPLQKDLLVILLFYLYQNTLSLQVNQLHCHLHKRCTQAIPSGPYAQALAYSSQHGLQIHRCISILLNNIYQYYCFLNNVVMMGKVCHAIFDDMGDDNVFLERNKKGKT